jgi:hypothetical protein
MSKAAQRAYTAIRDSIISGDYAPGMHLTESELAGIVGVSRTPVHDALLRLKADGLIEMQRIPTVTSMKYLNCVLILKVMERNWPHVILAMKILYNSKNSQMRWRSLERLTIPQVSMNSPGSIVVFTKK